MAPKKSSNRGLLIYVGVLLAAMILIVALMKQATKTVSEYSYSDIMSFFDNYQVSEYNFDLGTGELSMTVTLDDGTEKLINYIVPNVTVFLNEIQTGSENYRKEYNAVHPDAPLKMEYYKIQDNSWLYNLLPSVIIIILMVALFFFMMRQAGGGGKINSFSKANVKTTSNTKHTFDDVAGADEEKEELAEIVDFLKNPKKYSEMGARIPKGVLLMGPPGTGKTLLAKAVAGEAGVPFFSISGSDFVELYVGVGASRVRDLFETAKKNAPAIVFIDEIDAVGRHRGAGLGGGHDEREQTLNQLLVEMDGFEGNEGVIVIAATNRRDILDPALLRPGRFDRQITVSYPDIKGREEILKVHTKKKPLAPDVSLSTIAKSTAGFTGADLENLTNEAALIAARKEKKAITKADIEEAVIKVIAGPEKKSRVVTQEERRTVAYHEAGHAIVTYYLPSQDSVHQVTIIPHGGAGGMTIHLPSKEPSLIDVNAERIEDEIKVCMGGRVAEELIIGKGSAGAVSDLQRSTKIAKDMVTKYGLSKLGLVVYADQNDEPFVGMGYGRSNGISERVQGEIDDEIHRIVTENYEACVAMLKEHIDQLHILAKYLIAHEKIDGADFEKLMKGEITAETIEKDYEEYMKSVITPEDKAEVSEEKSDAPADNADTTAEASSAEDTSDAKADENASTEEKSGDSDENKE